MYNLSNVARYYEHQKSALQRSINNSVSIIIVT
jgi:hypothetical protein